MIFYFMKKAAYKMNLVIQGGNDGYRIYEEGIYVGLAHNMKELAEWLRFRRNWFNN